MVKFAHMADVHLGGWKFPELQELNFKSFQKAVDKCIEEKVEFILIAGDLFDTAYPSIEILKETFAEFKKIKEFGIPCFIISGSHDYSVSGKTFLDVLEKSGFCKNVTLFEDDGETLLLKPTIHKNIAFYGYPGKKTGLEIPELKRMKLQNLEVPADYKILMLHTTLDKSLESLGNLPIDSIEADSIPVTDYCALGHIHIKLHYKQFVYPGPVFPNNFAELEDLGYGHFCIVNTENENYLERIPLKIKDIVKINLQIESTSNATEKIISEIEKQDIEDKIILLRLSGELENSKVSDIKFQQIEEFAKQNGAYFLLKNTHNLKVREIEISAEVEESENVEEEIIKNYSEQSPSDLDKLTQSLMNSLSIEKQEGETSESFSSRLLGETRKILNF